MSDKKPQRIRVLGNIPENAVRLEHVRGGAVEVFVGRRAYLEILRDTMLGHLHVYKGDLLWCGIPFSYSDAGSEA